MSRHFGEIRQNGYVVHDIEAAMQHWTTVLGVGPFFYFERAPIEEFRYRGETSPLEVSIALAQTGALQIELIQPRNTAPSMYRDFLETGSEGLQHLAYWTERFDDDLARLDARGLDIGQSGQVGGPDGRFVYYETETHPGTVIELSEISGTKGRFFAHIAEVARSWDGGDPIRPMGG
ncbi:MAG: VOC family protein [Myxococcota bacterium]